MIRTATALLAALALAGCALPPEQPPAQQPPEWDDVVAGTARAWAGDHGWMPFAQGAVGVLAREDGQLRSYTLVPCRGGGAVCAGSLTGPAGQVSETRDYTVVQGLYGRTFYLSPHGDGLIGLPGGATAPLAWGPAERAPGPWVSARLGQGSAGR